MYYIIANKCCFTLNETYNLHYIKLACSICYRPVILHVSLAEYFMYSSARGCGIFVAFVAEEEGELQEPHFCAMCCSFFDD